MRKAKNMGDKVIVSIFVNPLQFGPGEDLGSYPRQFVIDCELAENEGVNAIFCPENKHMYGESFQTAISVKKLSQGMCGKDRPGHFNGVATVVAKLFNLTRADVAVFGQKDFQQLAIIRQLVKDLNFPIKIVGGPIIREFDGLAMSSRNKYLHGEARKQALCLYKSIVAARELIADGSHKILAQTVIDQTKQIISKAGAAIEYAVLKDESTLLDDVVVSSDSILVLAAKINGTVRLIDNGRLFPDYNEIKKGS
jgi:pantoate--beta-alanine ligase